MKQITLTSKSPDGKLLKASFLPEKGLNLISYIKGNIEVIDQKTKADFEDHYAGLGSLIGPHFYQQREEWIVPVANPDLFPYIANIKKRGSKDPFPHGIGRYVPWNVKTTKNKISATISGNDRYKGVCLSELEGVDFTMHFSAELLPDGLHIEMSVTSPRVSLAGLHYYYAIGEEDAIITSLVQDQYNDMGQFKPIPATWLEKDRHHLKFNLKERADYGFLPLTDDQGEIVLRQRSHQLLIHYAGENGEISWQLYHPKGASFVCIEPMSAKNPRGLTTASSSFKARIEIL